MSDEFDKRDWAEDLNEGIRSRDTWFRGLKIVVLLLFLAIARFALLVAVAYQFCFCLVRNRPSEVMLPVGRWLARYVEKIILFMTWNSDHPPFPFTPFNKVMEREPEDPDEETAGDERYEDFAAADMPDAPEPPPVEDEAAEEAPDDAEEPAEEPDDAEKPDSAEEPAEEPKKDKKGRSRRPPRPDA